MVISNKLEYEDNLNYRSLLFNEIDPTFTDEMIHVALEQRRNNLDNDNRPQIANEFNRQTNIILDKVEEEKVIKKIRESEEKKEKDRKTIMDMPLKDIISKTSETADNFWEDYNIKLIEAKHHYGRNNKTVTDNSWSNFLTIHSLAFVEYMKEKDHILYIGIFLGIISVIIYIFNITSS